jgi:predicted amino acid-binding ACT domain protein
VDVRVMTDVQTLSVLVSVEDEKRKRERVRRSVERERVERRVRSETD